MRLISINSSKSTAASRPVNTKLTVFYSFLALFYIAPNPLLVLFLYHEEGVILRVSVCIDMMFSHLDFYDRFAAVKKAGPETVEFWGWRNKDIGRVKDALDENALSLSICNLDSRDEALSAALMRGILNAGRKEELLKAVEESLPIYQKLGAKGMIVLIGERLDMPYDRQIENIVTCLRYVQPTVEQSGMTLLLEPLNDIDRKNYLLPRCDAVAAILRQVNSPRMQLLFDLYHEGMMGGDLLQGIAAYGDLVGHYHVADAPGRHEPGTGTIDYARVLQTIRDSAFDGFVGLEYRATRPDETTLDFLKYLR